MLEGNLLKMQSQFKDVVEYSLPVGKHLIPLNEWIGQKIRIEFLGQINDIHDGHAIKKSYGQGYSYQNFISLACCDFCIVRPEKCHYHLGTCREPQWGEEYCLVEHVVYLALTSTVKVGVTRCTQIPTRWIDQGATRAIPLVAVGDRLTAGLIEVEMKSNFEDKTNWRKMLLNQCEIMDLTSLREGVFDQFADLFDDHGAEEMEDEEVAINYPVQRYPLGAIRSLGLDKTPVIEGILHGIKGQYLIFERNVFNVRNHQGYLVRWNQ